MKSLMLSNSESNLRKTLLESNRICPSYFPSNTDMSHLSPSHQLSASLIGEQISRSPCVSYFYYFCVCVRVGVCKGGSLMHMYRSYGACVGCLIWFCAFHL